jgi:hypothetical protein
MAQSGFSGSVLPGRVFCSKIWLPRWAGIVVIDPFSTLPSADVDYRRFG